MTALARLAPAPAPRLLCAAEVAHLLGICRATFYRRRPTLEAAGFPRPVSGIGHRWDPVSIGQWLARQRAPRPGVVPAPDDAAGWEAEIARRLAD